jgi:hypothetical protein
MMVINPIIRSVTACQICIMKEQGIENPEDHVLTSYQLTSGVDGLPIPMDADISQEGGVLVLYPESDPRQKKLPMVGGLFGSVRSLFKVLGFDMPEKEPPPSQEVAERKGHTGLYGERKGKEVR